ncbi:MAG: MMPL family transporter [Spirochaetia bacterium]|jgi:hydrophobe/amphiphile efflux-3 (HAE3) family protein|nr:MMPL family transporter [Spirochaetia bacterium]
MIERYFEFQERHKKIILALIILVTVFFAYHASQIKIDANYSELIDSVKGDLQYEGGTGTFDATKFSFPSKKEVDLDSIINTPIPKDFSAEAEHVYPKRIKQVGADEPVHSNLVVLVDSPNLLTPVFLTTLQIVMENMQNQTDVISISSLFSMYTVQKKGSRLVIVPLSPHKGDQPWTDAEALEFRKRLAADGIVKENLISNDLDAIMFSFKISSIGDARLQELVQQLKPLQDLGATISVTGGTPIQLAMFKYLQHDLGVLLAFCFLMILLVYYLSFKAKRSMLLPLSLSIISIIWTIGTMQLLGYSITLMNVITPCMVMTLGSSYAIHMLSEYYTEVLGGKGCVSVPCVASRISSTIVLAAVTTVMGFLALLISDTDEMKQFGIAVSLGIVYCAFLSLTYLPILLSSMRIPPQSQQESYENGFFTRIIKKLAVAVVEKWWKLCLVLVLIVVGFGLTYAKVSVNSNYMSYFPSDDPVYKSSKSLAMRIGGDTSPQIIKLTAPKGSTRFFEDAKNLKEVENFQNQIMKSPDVRQILSFPGYVSYINKVYSGHDGIPDNPAMINFILRMIELLEKQQGDTASVISSIISDDGNTTELFVRNFDSQAKDLTTIASSTRLKHVIEACLPLLPAGTSVTVSGANVSAMLFSNQLMHDQFLSSLLAYLLVFLVASLAFRSFKMGLYPLVPVGIAIMMNFIFMYILGIPFDMVTICFANVAIGAGVDDSIHFLIHYKENKHLFPSYSEKQTIRYTIETTGRPIALTTLSIVAGMLMLVFGKYVPIRYFGILMSIALFNSMLATLLILPSVLIFIDFLKKKAQRTIG